VVVLDDLHWADQSSLALLGFLARARLEAPLLIVGAYRHDQLEPATRDVLAGLASRTEHVHLEGLNEPDVAALVASVAGEQHAERWAAEIHGRTGGHPFFVREMAYLLDTAGDAVGVPSVVRDAIQQRLAQLPGQARGVLDAAAVAGNEIATEVLADALAVDVDEVVEGLGLALKAGMLRSTPGGTPRFAHDLLRETLYDALAPSKRVALHRRIAVALEHRADQGGSVMRRPATSTELGWRWHRPASTSPGMCRSTCWSPRPKRWLGPASPTRPESCWCVRVASPKRAGTRPGSGPSRSACSASGPGSRCGAMT
jgi:predicted ATPase